VNGVLDFLLRSRRLVLASVVLLALAGLASWITMPREEDPQFPHRDGLVIAGFPGADAETVERLVVEPLEDSLSEVEEVNNVYSTSRAGVAILHVEMHETVYNTEKAWDEVEDAVKKAQREFPSGVLEPEIRDDLVSQDAVVLAIEGSADPLVLLGAARTLKRALSGIDAVKKVNFVGDPGEQITIELDDAAARRLGIDTRSLGLQLGARSALIPGGVILLGEKTASLRPQTEFRSLDEIRGTQVLLPSGASVPLGAFATVRQGVAEPPTERMRWNGEPAIAVGVVPQDGLDRVKFGEAVRRKTAEVAATLAPLEIKEVVFQPDLVKTRLAELTANLEMSILIVAVFLLLTMGLRLGFVVSWVIPLVTYGAVALFAGFGGILHQISIAALVIGMGMLVDNAIVVAEAVQYRIDRGEPRHLAALGAVRELAVPLGTSTGTTVAVFLPMLLAKGNTADFTRTIPWLVILTLTLSYVFALLVTPILSEMFLKPQKIAGDGETPGRFLAAGRLLAHLATRRSWLVVAGAVLMVGLAAWASRFVDLRFFPQADRNTVIIDVEMPEGTHLEATDALALRLERALQERPGVASVATFVGRAAPKFYYNLLSRPNSPHRAQLVAETTSLKAADQVLGWVGDFARRELPEANVVPRRLEQGPPIEAPVELRVVGHDFGDLERAADLVLAELRDTEGTRDVRHDLGFGVPTVSFEIDDAAASRSGLSRADVAQALLGRTLGAQIGQYRQGEDPVPILLRSKAGELLPPAELPTIDVARPGGKPVPLAQVARLAVEWRPAVILHDARQRVVHVQAQTLPGYTPHEVVQAARPRLDTLELPAGVELQLGGELEEAGKANSAMMAAMPLGILLLLFFLLIEFNSFRRMGIILVTVPLAGIGVVPGLILSAQPFGFMAILGLIALVGIVVNNAIVLIDLIEVRRDEGKPLDQALGEAIVRRTRPILLTAGTTVLGLLPLGFTEATLWPPLAWTIMAGLSSSTLLTLLVIPAIYKLVFDRDDRRRRAAMPAPAAPEPAAQEPSLGSAGALAAGCLALFFFWTPGLAEAQPAQRMTLAEVMEKAKERPLAQAARAQARVAESVAEAKRRNTFWPQPFVTGDLARRDNLTTIETPIGDFTLGERSSSQVLLQVNQPLFDPAAVLYGLPATRAAAEAARGQATRTGQQLAAEAAERFLGVLEIDARLAATEAFVASLEARLGEMEERVAAGRVLEADALKVRLGLESAQLERDALREMRLVALAALALSAGLEQPVEPAWDGPPARDELPSLEAARDAALSSRADFAAIGAQLKSLALEKRAIKAEILPRLEASGTYVRSDGDPFLPEELAQGKLTIKWAPFVATRSPRVAAATAREEALEAQLLEIRRGVEVELKQALAELGTARRAAVVRGRGVELASETLRVERERSGAGRSTTNDLLAAEATLREQRTQRDLAELAVVRAWLKYDLAIGNI
jgi:multidrug efflux pump subunit AcrB/outer membrane protein TolC